MLVLVLVPVLLVEVDVEVEEDDEEDEAELEPALSVAEDPCVPLVVVPVLVPTVPADVKPFVAELSTAQAVTTRAAKAVASSPE